MSEGRSHPAVFEVLPHREPFSFLDEVGEVGEGRLVGHRVVRAEEPQFRGHYPGRPLMPGVLLCEMALQAGAYLMARRADVEWAGFPVVTRIKNVRFKRQVVPGDRVDVEVTHDESVSGVHWMTGRLRVNGKLVCDMSFAVTLVKEEAVR